MPRPKVDVDGIQNGEQWEPPRDTINDNALSVGEELVDDGTEQEKMYRSPDEERPRCRSDIGLLPIVIDG